MGSWLFVGKTTFPDTVVSTDEQNFLKAILKLDSLYGYIVRYGIKSTSNNKIKGVDVHLVCQMLVGAFQDEYDTCILVSDDPEFIPAIEIAQNFYKRRIFHAGFEKGILRAACYGSIPFGKENNTINFSQIFDQNKTNFQTFTQNIASQF